MAHENQAVERCAHRRRRSQTRSFRPCRASPGATFVFSQVLSVNDKGIAVGYYGDSTTSQHGFIYNTNTGQYTFLDDPKAAFSNGVEVTQITGITNSGEITGFYSDANGVFHGFVATVAKGGATSNLDRSVSESRFRGGTSGRGTGSLLAVPLPISGTTRS